MVKKMSKLLVFTAVIAAVALFDFRWALAQSPFDSVQCKIYAKNGSFSESQYFVNVTGDGVWPAPATCTKDGNDFSCFRYSYAVTDGDGNPISGSGQFTTMVQFCRNENPASKRIQLLLESPNDNSIQQIYELGEGEPVYNWGESMFHEYAARSATNSLLEDFVLYSITNDVDLSTIHIKIGNERHVCGPVLAAGCPEFERAQAAVLTSKRVELVKSDGTIVEICLTTDPITQCDVVVNCTTGDPIQDSQAPTLNGLPIVSASTPGTGCETMVLENPPGASFWYYSGGRWWYFP